MPDGEISGLAVAFLADGDLEPIDDPSTLTRADTVYTPDDVCHGYDAGFDEGVRFRLEEEERRIRIFVEAVTGLQPTEAAALIRLIQRD